MIVGIIWYYTNREMAKERLESLIVEYKRQKINVKKRTKTEVIFDNNDVWKIAASNSNSRGMCCNIGLIEEGTPENIIRTIIMPCIKNKPYRAYNYW